MPIDNRDFRAINVTPDTIKRLVNIIEEYDNDATYVIKKHGVCSQITAPAPAPAPAPVTQSRPNALVQLPLDLKPAPRVRRGRKSPKRQSTPLLERDLIKALTTPLRAANGHGVSYNDLRKNLVAEGFSKTSFGSALTSLVDAGYAERVDGDHVVLTAAGQAAIH